MIFSILNFCWLLLSKSWLLFLLVKIRIFFVLFRALWVHRQSNFLPLILKFNRSLAKRRKFIVELEDVVYLVNLGAFLKPKRRTWFLLFFWISMRTLSIFIAPISSLLWSFFYQFLRVESTQDLGCVFIDLESAFFFSKLEVYVELLPCFDTWCTRHYVFSSVGRILHVLNQESMEKSKVSSWGSLFIDGYYPL